MKYFFLAVLIAIAVVLVVAGKPGHYSSKPPFEIFPDMDRQLKVKAQKPSTFFADGRAARMPVTGTISTNVPVDQEYFYTGAIGNQWGDGFPLEVTPALIKRGAERFAINCQVCHGASGKGDGIVSQYGLVGIANYHDDRLRKMADGEIFNTITHGKGQMYGYGANISPADRWAIVAYVRVLQRSQNATLQDVPEADRAKLTEEASATPVKQ